jgi:hypothetical protein
VILGELTNDAVAVLSRAVADLLRARSALTSWFPPPVSRPYETRRRILGRLLADRAVERPTGDSALARLLEHGLHGDELLEELHALDCRSRDNSMCRGMGARASCLESGSPSRASLGRERRIPRRSRQRSVASTAPGRRCRAPSDERDDRCGMPGRSRIDRRCLAASRPSRPRRVGRPGDLRSITIHQPCATSSFIHSIRWRRAPLPRSPASAPRTERTYRRRGLNRHSPGARPARTEPTRWNRRRSRRRRSDRPDLTRSTPALDAQSPWASQRRFPQRLFAATGSSSTISLRDARDIKIISIDRGVEKARGVIKRGRTATTLKAGTSWASSSRSSRRWS